MKNWEEVYIVTKWLYDIELLIMNKKEFTKQKYSISIFDLENYEISDITEMLNSFEKGNTKDKISSVLIPIID